MLALGEPRIVVIKSNPVWGIQSMSTNLRLTLACGDYEITRPLMDGRVKPAGIDLIVITPESRERHWREIGRAHV